ncbi:MAG: hypothetical protein GX359_00900 [Clostridiales bacterium]|nr:hypothetical protein [Clostridiales bacterium]
MTKRIILTIVFIILILLVSFFGLGPVLFADGTRTERLLTLFVVIALYIIIFISFYFLNKRIRK